MQLLTITLTENITAFTPNQPPTYEFIICGFPRQVKTRNISDHVTLDIRTQTIIVPWPNNRA